MKNNLLNEIQNIVQIHGEIYAPAKIQASKEIESALFEIKKLQSVIDQKEKLVNRLKNQVKEFLGDNEVLTNDYQEEIATWKYSKPGTKFDAKSFEKEHPRMYKSYIVSGDPKRTFLVKK